MVWFVTNAWLEKGDWILYHQMITRQSFYFPIIPGQLLSIQEKRSGNWKYPHRTRAHLPDTYRCTMQNKKLPRQICSPESNFQGLKQWFPQNFIVPVWSKAFV